MVDVIIVWDPFFERAMIKNPRFDVKI